MYRLRFDVMADCVPAAGDKLEEHNRAGVRLCLKLSIRSTGDILCGGSQRGCRTFRYSQHNKHPSSSSSIKNGS